MISLAGPPRVVAPLAIDGDAVASVIMRACLAALAITSMGLFHEGILKLESLGIQQAAIAGLWLMLVSASLFVRPRRPLAFELDALAIAAFYGFSIVSVAWTSLDSSNLLKSAALLLTSIGAIQIASRMTFAAIIGAVTSGLAVLAFASIASALFDPEHGVSHTYFHEGQWQGVFVSKQTLGILGAYLLFLTCYRKLAGRGWFEFLILAAAATTCLVMSASRGAFGIAASASAVLFLGFWSRRLYAIFAAGLPLMLLLAALMLGILWITGEPDFEVFGTHVDLTERTLIWQHALARLHDAPLLGYGLNGFWTRRSIYDYFEQNHGWVLDNYHNGYLAILVETGLAGFVLFTFLTLVITAKLLYLNRDQGIARSDAALLLGFYFLTCQINLTETIFLRSTSLISVLGLALLIAACTPVRSPSPSPGRP